MDDDFDAGDGFAFADLERANAGGICGDLYSNAGGMWDKWRWIIDTPQDRILQHVCICLSSLPDNIGDKSAIFTEIKNFLNKHKLEYLNGECLVYAWILKNLSNTQIVPLLNKYVNTEVSMYDILRYINFVKSL